MTDYEFTSIGTLKYDPKRSGMDYSRTKWWCVLEVDEGIAEYYRWWLDRHWWEADILSKKRKYSRPSTAPHISIIRGERPRRNINLWNKNNHEKIQFKYSCTIRQTGDTTGYDRDDHFWFLDVKFDEFIGLRSQFGLPVRDYVSLKPFSAHLTFARAYS